MSRITLRITIALFILCAVHAVTAQDLTTKITPPATAPVITGTASAERLRFTAPNTVVQMHLQIYDNAGQLLFDVTSKGNVLDWTMPDSGGEHLVPGSYLCVGGVMTGPVQMVRLPRESRQEKVREHETETVDRARWLCQGRYDGHWQKR